MGLEIITSQLWKRTGQQVVSPIQATIIIFKINFSIEKGILPIEFGQSSKKYENSFFFSICMVLKIATYFV